MIGVEWISSLSRILAQPISRRVAVREISLRRCHVLDRPRRPVDKGRAPCSVSSRQKSDQAVKCDREFARAGNADYPTPLCQGIHVRVLLDQDRFERGHIGIHGNVVLAKAGSRTSKG